MYKKHVSSINMIFSAFFTLPKKQIFGDDQASQLCRSWWH